MASAPPITSSFLASSALVVGSTASGALPAGAATFAVAVTGTTAAPVPRAAVSCAAQFPPSNPARPTPSTAIASKRSVRMSTSLAFSMWGLNEWEGFIADSVPHRQLYEGPGSQGAANLASPTDSGGRVTQWPFESAGDDRDT